jgi:hypothetical protein
MNYEQDFTKSQCERRPISLLENARTPPFQQMQKVREGKATVSF